MVLRVHRLASNEGMRLKSNRGSWPLKALPTCPKLTPGIPYSELPLVSHTPAEVTSSWLTSACGFKCHQIHPYASCLLSSYLFEIWECWISLQHKSLCPVICLWWISLIELFSRKNKRLWWPMWNPNRKAYGRQHNTMNVSLPPTRTEDALVLRRDEFFSLQHTDEKTRHLCSRLHIFSMRIPPEK